MGFMKEFKAFAMKGNMVDMAVGMIIGGAFGKIVGSLVNDVIMPPASLLLGDKGFSDMFYALDGNKYKSIAAAKDAGAAVFAYGSFIQNIVDFLILAFAIFMMVKAINRMKKKEEEAPAPAPEPTASEKLLTEIRDLLKK